MEYTVFINGLVGGEKTGMTPEFLVLAMALP